MKKEIQQNVPSFVSVVVSFLVGTSSFTLSSLVVTGSLTFCKMKEKVSVSKTVFHPDCVSPSSDLHASLGSQYHGIDFTSDFSASRAFS